MSTYKQVLPDNAGDLAVRTKTMDRVARSGNTVKHILVCDATDDDTYAVSAGEQITMIKAIGNAVASDIEFKWKDVEHTSFQTSVIEESDSMIGPFTEVAIIPADEGDNTAGMELVLYINKN
tara:strand:- start:29 stop:394 length:366 start_codon:yes stop_codon:yes gene_type:complete